MIAHDNSVNSNYDITQIFLYLPKLCRIREAINPDSEDEQNNFDVYDKLLNIHKKKVISPPKIQNINGDLNLNLNNILYINYINSINNDVNSFILNYLFNRIATNNAFNQILGNYLPNLNNYSNLQPSLLNNSILFNNINVSNNINNNFYVKND